jgi:hypothetical protein
MAAPDPQTVDAMWQIVGSKLLTKPLYAAAKVGVPDQLAQGPLPVEEIARRTGTHAPSLYRVLRALASAGIFAEDAGRVFRNTPASELFMDSPESMRAMLLWINDPRHDHAWESFLYSVQTGETAISASSGTEVWQWLREQPDLHEIFHRAMTSNAGYLHRAAVDAYDFSGIDLLVDVGAGHGHLLTKILHKFRTLRGIAFDRPEVVAGAHAEIESGGVATRCDIRSGDFFHSVPDGDAHIMSFIVHDWHDEPATAILRNIHSAQSAGGKVLLVETVVPAGNDRHFGKLIDMEMLALARGRERTADEFEVLLDGGGFQLTRIVQTEAPCAVIEGRRRS